MRYLILTLATIVALGGCVTESSGRKFKESPRDAAAYNYQLGVEYLRNGKLKQARERLESSVRQNPSVAQTHFTLAILYQRLNESKLADAAYRDAIRVAPDDGAVQNSYAIYLCGKKKFTEAERYFVRAANNPLYATPAAALTNAGVCMTDKPDLKAAEIYFRRALDVDEEFGDALMQMAQLKRQQGNLLSARAFLQRLMDVKTPTPEMLLLAWRVEKSLGDDRAATLFAEALERDFPNSQQMMVVREGG